MSIKQTEVLPNIILSKIILLLANDCIGSAPPCVFREEHITTSNEKALKSVVRPLLPARSVCKYFNSIILPYLPIRTIDLTSYQFNGFQPVMPPMALGIHNVGVDGSNQSQGFYGGLTDLHDQQKNVRRQINAQVELYKISSKSNNNSSGATTTPPFMMQQPAQPFMMQPQQQQPSLNNIPSSTTHQQQTHFPIFLNNPSQPLNPPPQPFMMQPQQPSQSFTLQPQTNVTNNQQWWQQYTSNIPLFNTINSPPPPQTFSPPPQPFMNQPQQPSQPFMVEQSIQSPALQPPTFNNAPSFTTHQITPNFHPIFINNNNNSNQPQPFMIQPQQTQSFSFQPQQPSNEGLSNLPIHFIKNNNEKEKRILNLEKIKELMNSEVESIQKQIGIIDKQIQFERTGSETLQKKPSPRIQPTFAAPSKDSDMEIRLRKAGFDMIHDYSTNKVKPSFMYYRLILFPNLFSHFTNGESYVDLPIKYLELVIQQSMYPDTNLNQIFNTIRNIKSITNVKIKFACHPSTEVFAHILEFIKSSTLPISLQIGENSFGFDPSPLIQLFFPKDQLQSTHNITELLITSNITLKDLNYIISHPSLSSQLETINVKVLESEFVSDTADVKHFIEVLSNNTSIKNFSLLDGVSNSFMIDPPSSDAMVRIITRNKTITNLDLEIRALVNNSLLLALATNMTIKQLVIKSNNLDSDKWTTLLKENKTLQFLCLPGYLRGGVTNDLVQSLETNKTLLQLSLESDGWNSLELARALLKSDTLQYIHHSDKKLKKYYTKYSKQIRYSNYYIFEY